VAPQVEVSFFRPFVLDAAHDFHDLERTIVKNTIVKAAKANIENN
jgi:hypothetical protein